MKVHEIMSAPPWTCRVDSDLAAASLWMTQTGTGMLVALDGHGRIAGVVTDRDLALAIGEGRGDVRARHVRDVMTGHVRTCREDDTVDEALATMTAGHVRRLPVLGSGGDLKGVLSIDDIILWAVHRGGVSAKDLADALRGVCAPRHVEADPAI
jgi:CBS domain-containing protein